MVHFSGHFFHVNFKPPLVSIDGVEMEFSLKSICPFLRNRKIVTVSLAWTEVTHTLMVKKISYFLITIHIKTFTFFTFYITSIIFFYYYSNKIKNLYKTKLFYFFHTNSFYFILHQLLLITIQKQNSIQKLLPNTPSYLFDYNQNDYGFYLEE